MNNSKIVAQANRTAGLIGVVKIALIVLILVSNLIGAVVLAVAVSQSSGDDVATLSFAAVVVGSLVAALAVYALFGWFEAMLRTNAAQVRTDLRQDPAHFERPTHGGFQGVPVFDQDKPSSVMNHGTR